MPALSAPIYQRVAVTPRLRPALLGQLGFVLTKRIEQVRDGARSVGENVHRRGIMMFWEEERCEPLIALTLIEGPSAREKQEKIGRTV